jgi:hypothetical protein
MIAFVVLDPSDVWYLSKDVFYFGPYLWIILPWIIFCKLPFMRQAAKAKMLKLGYDPVTGKKKE